MRTGGLLFVAALACGCSTPTTYESFRVVPDRNVEIAYINVAADFSQYGRLMGDDMGIYYPTEAAPSEQDLERVRNAFRNAFFSELEHYEIVDKPAADVLLIRASLVDLRRANPQNLPRLSRDIMEIVKAGKLTFMIEMLDSRSERVLARAADTQRSPEIDLPELNDVDDSEVVAAAEHWAGLLRGFLDQNLGGPWTRE